VEEMNENQWYTPERVEEEYKVGQQFKSGLGRRGMYEQNKMNERFFVGDQWHGAQCGQDRPLLQHNVIKRIGDYKMAVVGAASVTVSYSADGVPCVTDEREHIRATMEDLAKGGTMDSLSESEKINLIMGAMSDYFRVTAERVKFEDKKTAVLRNAYISGTGVLYTYWDDRIMTGLYADEGKTTPHKGDIACQVLDIENVYFGDPNLDSVQDQPYIILAQRKRIDEIKREMRRNRRPQDEIDSVKPDQDTGYQAGDRAENEPTDAKKAVVLTKLYKEWDEHGDAYKVMAVETCGKAMVRKPWDTKLRLYPIAKMNWETRHNCAYGDSEITNLIPNQIAINRANTAAAWAVMILGMPIMVVDGDVVTGTVTNDPGQIIKVYGSNGNPISFAQPPAFSPQFENLVNSLINNTLAQNGANDAALGNMRPDNMSAIVAVREAATMPMQMTQNRFYSFIEDVARIWAEFWVCLYGSRSLHISDKSGDWYLPFNGDDHKNLLISTKIDVGAAGVWSEAQSIQTLDGLLNAGVIDPMQYLERLPKGIVPDLNGLLREYRERAQTQVPNSDSVPSDQGEGVDMAELAGGMTIDEKLAQLPPEYQQAWAQMTPEQQAQVLQQTQGTTI
jgi:hypothetical protein